MVYEMFMQAIKQATTVKGLKTIIKEINADEGLAGRGRQWYLIQLAHEKMHTIPLETLIRELAEHLL